MKWKGEKGLRDQLVHIEKLKEDPRNARLHDDRNIAAIKLSLDTYGQQKAVVCRKGILVAGSGTLRAARVLGWTHLAVVQTSLSAADAMAYAIADNRTTDLSTFDPKKLQANLMELARHGVDAANMLAIKPKELKEMLAKFERENPTETTEDEVPEPPKVARSHAGEIYLLGSHRLMCGDSTSAEDVGKLMAGDKADMIFTDPPYGVSIGTKNKFLNTLDQNSGRCTTDLESDTKTPDELYEVLLGVFRNARSVMKDFCAIYVCSPQG